MASGDMAKLPQTKARGQAVQSSGTQGLTERLLLSCEHASSRVLAADRRRLSVDEEVLLSHRGWDAGALRIARELAKQLQVQLLEGEVSRLLVDLNRSAHHRQVLGSLGRALPPARQAALLTAHRAYWDEARQRTAGLGAPALHLSVHSFTPVLGQDVRNYDVGLLYDPSRPLERAWVLSLRTALLSEGFSVRRNAPYRGVADGLCTALRRQRRRGYAGIELELNQALVGREAEALMPRSARLARERALLRALVAGLTRGPMNSVARAK